MYDTAVGVLFFASNEEYRQTDRQIHEAKTKHSKSQPSIHMVAERAKLCRYHPESKLLSRIRTASYNRQAPPQHNHS